jgi:hypothetical protein
VAPSHSPTCITCGYDLAGLGPDSTCPECGATDAGIVIETPLTFRCWAAEGARFILARHRSLRRPVVRGRADVCASIAAVGLACFLMLWGVLATSTRSTGID